MGKLRKRANRLEWSNILDPRFNLHPDETRDAEAFVMVKPSEDGDVTAGEAYDDAGGLVVQLFSARKPGVPELQPWRDIVAGLPRAEAVAA